MISVVGFKPPNNNSLALIARPFLKIVNFLIRLTEIVSQNHKIREIYNTAAIVVARYSGCDFNKSGIGSNLA